MKKLLGVALVLLSTNSFATTFTKLDLCEILGYHQGYQDDFIANMVFEALSDSSLLFDSQCKALRQHSFNITREHSKTGDAKLLQSNESLVRKANRFSSEIYRSILNDSGIEIIDK